jgi:uncharacterized NAD(P)/FAD-binding protein YdhS
MPAVTRPSLAIVGGGLSGAALAWQLLRKSDRPIEVRVIERLGPIGAGVAYRTSHPAHLLNVRTRAMSLDPDAPDHLLRWLAAEGQDAARTWNASLDPEGFVPRALYREYVDHALRSASREARDGVTLERITGHAMNAEVESGGVSIRIDDDRLLRTGSVVLAIGNPSPAHPTPVDLPFYRSGRYIRDPWSEESISTIERDDHVLVLGSNLTMFDVAVSLASRSHRGPITALSRHGLISTAHGDASSVAVPFPPGSVPRGLRELVRTMRERARDEEARGSGWRSVIDGFRPTVSQAWRQFSDADRRRFLAHVRPFWEIHRHRAPVEVMAGVDALRASGQLTFRAGRIRRIEEMNDRVSVTFLARGATREDWIRVDRIVNATGPDADYRRVDDPFLNALFDAGQIRPGPLGMGLDAEEDGAIVDARGQRSRLLSTLGPTLRGALWETTAVPEIRVQARALAERLLREIHG